MKNYLLIKIFIATVLIIGHLQAEEVSLNGSWRFAYTKHQSKAKVNERFTVAVMVEPNPRLPVDEEFALSMEVPGYWDNQLSYIPEAPWGDQMVYNEQASVPIRFPYPLSGRPRHPDAPGCR